MISGEVEVKLICLNSLNVGSEIWWQSQSKVDCRNFNPLSAKFTKWSNTLKQVVGKLSFCGIGA